MQLNKRPTFYLLERGWVFSLHNLHILLKKQF